MPFYLNLDAPPYHMPLTPTNTFPSTSSLRPDPINRGMHKGTGYVVYANEATAFRAMQALNGRLLNGRPLNVQPIQVEAPPMQTFGMPTSAPPTSVAGSLS